MVETWVRVEVYLNYGFVFSDKRPRAFFAAPRPRRGRYFLPPRDPSDPATLPTLQAARRSAAAVPRCRPPQRAVSDPPEGPVRATEGDGGGGGC